MRQFKGLSEWQRFWAPACKQAKPLPHDGQVLSLRDLKGPFMSYYRLGSGRILKQKFGHYGCATELIFSKTDSQVVKLYGVMPFDEIIFPSIFINQYKNKAFLMSTKNIELMKSETLFYSFPKDGDFKVSLTLYQANIHTNTLSILNSLETEIYLFKYNELGKKPPVESLRDFTLKQLYRKNGINSPSYLSIMNFLVKWDSENQSNKP